MTYSLIGYTNRVLYIALNKCNDNESKSINQKEVG